MARYNRSSEADSRLAEIWLYSAQKWGSEQADTYLRKLEGSFQRIADGLAATHSCTRFDPHAPEDVRYHLSERHFVLFRPCPTDSDAIDILTLIHNSSSRELDLFLEQLRS